MEDTFVPHFVKIGQAIAWTNWSGQRKKHISRRTYYYHFSKNGLINKFDGKRQHYRIHTYDVNEMSQMMPCS